MASPDAGKLPCTPAKTGQWATPAPQQAHDDIRGTDVSARANETCRRTHDMQQICFGNPYFGINFLLIYVTQSKAVRCSSISGCIRNKKPSHPIKNRELKTKVIRATKR